MAFLSSHAALVQPTPDGHVVLASSGNFLVKPGIGLMVWTLIVFGVTLVLLWRLAFPRITEALDRRQKAIEDSIDMAERTREEAHKLLDEYRQRLAEARAQSDEIVQRARQTAEAHEHEASEQARTIAQDASARAARDIEAATARALDELRAEVANLTVMATEKVTRKVLGDADQRRLVEEALSELDFSGISPGGAGD
jgi:F-type H+-transporting ATPase subunit b